MFLDLFYRFQYGEITCSIANKESFRTFCTEDEAESWGHHHYDAWATSYTEISRSASSVFNRIRHIPFTPIEVYCGNLYEVINNSLRGLSDDANSINVELSHILTMTLCSAPRIPEEIIAYRSVCDDFMWQLIDQNKKSTRTLEKGFLSTTLIESAAVEIAKNNGHKNILKIYIPKNTIGIYANSVVKRNEYELLIAPNRFIAMADYPHEYIDDIKMTECLLINT